MYLETVRKCLGCFTQRWTPVGRFPSQAQRHTQNSAAIFLRERHIGLEQMGLMRVFSVGKLIKLGEALFVLKCLFEFAIPY